MSAPPDGKSILESMRAARDAGIEAWAKVTHQVTSSDAYARVSNRLAQPGLIAEGIWRAASEKAMAQTLEKLNLPSRQDVLALSQRLTHIEMVLDDLAAAVNGLRPAKGK